MIPRDATVAPTAKGKNKSLPTTLAIRYSPNRAAPIPRGANRAPHLSAVAPDRAIAPTIKRRGTTIFLSPQPTAITLSQWWSRNRPVPIMQIRYPKAGRKNRVSPLELDAK